VVLGSFELERSIAVSNSQGTVRRGVSLPPRRAVSHSLLPCSAQTRQPRTWADVCKRSSISFFGLLRPERRTSSSRVGSSDAPVYP